MSCPQALVNKRNIDSVVTELNKLAKKNTELSTALEQAKATIAGMQVELGSVKQLAVRSIGTGATK